MLNFDIPMNNSNKKLRTLFKLSHYLYEFQIIPTLITILGITVITIQLALQWYRYTYDGIPEGIVISELSLPKYG